MRLVLVLGLAALFASGCSVVAPSVARGPSVAVAPVITTVPAPVAVRRTDYARFEPDDLACRATVCAYRVLVSQVWDLVRR